MTLLRGNGLKTPPIQGRSSLGSSGIAWGGIVGVMVGEVSCGTVRVRLGGLDGVGWVGLGRDGERDGWCRVDWDGRRLGTKIGLKFYRGSSACPRGPWGLLRPPC